LRHDAADDAASAMSMASDDTDAATMTAPTPACGDGILNGTELCDPKIAATNAARA
jgi:hypothetical protein